MAAPKKVIAPDQFVWVRSIYGKGPDAKKRYEHIVDGGMNKVIKDWQDKQPEHPRDVASPSTLTTCPRVAWLLNKNVPVTNEMTWAVKQRMLLGRLFEDQFALQLKDAGQLIHHWKDNPGDKVDKFVTGEGINKLQGVPDYLAYIDNEGERVVAVSDAKTSRSDSFGYIGITQEDMFSDWGWYKYRIQLTAYFKLCMDNSLWLAQNGYPHPEYCHLFSYALDDGVVRREALWLPTQEDFDTVERLTRRYNEAVASPTMPACTCHESFDNFDVKFCKFGVVEPGAKIAEKCCDDSLIELVKE